MQIGGRDQYGNIAIGIDLIRRRQQKTAFGFTLPLLTTADGKKIGKSTMRFHTDHSPNDSLLSDTDILYLTEHTL